MQRFLRVGGLHGELLVASAWQKREGSWSAVKDLGIAGAREEGRPGAADHTGEMATGVREQGSVAFVAVLIRLMGLMRSRPCVGPVLIGPGHGLIFMGLVACCFGPNSWALSPTKRLKENRSYTI